MRARLRDAGLAETAIDPTIRRYGTEAMTIARLIGERADLATAMGDGRTSHADVVYAARYEAVSRISDVTLRRTHLAWFTKDHARADAPAIADLLQQELGWSDEERARQLEAHDAELRAEKL